MKETVWDKYWKKQQEIKLENITRTLALLKDFEDYHLNAVFLDLFLPTLSFAKRNADNNKIIADFVLADGFRLPFPDETFDIVWNEGVNEHFEGEQRQKIFDEMARVCVTGGKMIVIAPNALNLPYRITKRILELRNQWIYGFEKTYTIFEQKRRMRDAGITPSKSSGAQIIISLLTFLELIHSEASPKKKENVKTLEQTTSRSKIKRLLEVIMKIDEHLEVVFGTLLGKDIGIKGGKRC